MPDPWYHSTNLIVESNLSIVLFCIIWISVQKIRLWFQRFIDLYVRKVWFIGCKEIEVHWWQCHLSFVLKMHVVGSSHATSSTIQLPLYVIHSYRLLIFCSETMWYFDKPINASKECLQWTTISDLASVLLLPTNLFKDNGIQCKAY